MPRHDVMEMPLLFKLSIKMNANAEAEKIQTKLQYFEAVPYQDIQDQEYVIAWSEWEKNTVTAARWITNVGLNLT
jgi:hypothetical protein